jgi:hypothetical protein
MSFKSPISSLDSEPELLRLKPIPKFSKVKPLLEKAGFRFAEGRVLRPERDTRNSEAFADESELRLDLCKYGLSDYEGWKDKEREQVEEWIRYTHIKDVACRRYKLLDASEFNKYREKLGITLRDSVYQFPEGGPSLPLYMEKSLLDHLSRYGLPPGCKEEALTDEERLSFDVYVCVNSSKALYVPPSLPIVRNV